MVAATTTTLFESCEPWPDIISGAGGRCSVEATAVIAGNASPPYGDAVTFFSRTYPRRGYEPCCRPCSEGWRGTTQPAR